MKNELRSRIKLLRKNITVEERTELSKKIQRKFLSSKLYRDAKTIMLYMPISGEVDTSEIINRCFDDGKTVLVPVCEKETYDLRAHIISDNTVFEKGAFSVSEPKNTKEFDKSKIDIILVPGVAFSKNGGRIGFGKGCYDRFLNGITAKKIGLCYDFQLSEFTHEQHDEIMDIIITQSQIIYCNMDIEPMTANYHTHTYFCHHATGTPREYVLEAIENGLEVLGFSDHNPCPFTNGFYTDYRIDLCDTQKYIDEINALKIEFADKIKIYLGYEMEYYPKEHENTMNYLNKFRFDYIILGQHFTKNGYDGVYSGAKCSEDGLKEYVDQLIEAINTGVFSYIAHPDIINFVGDDTVYEREMTRLLKAAKKLDIPVEFNLLGFYESRLYPTDRFFRLVKKVGNDVIIGSDAHTKEACGNQSIYQDAILKLREFGITPIKRIKLRK